MHSSVTEFWLRFVERAWCYLCLRRVFESGRGIRSYGLCNAFRIRYRNLHSNDGERSVPCRFSCIKLPPVANDNPLRYCGSEESQQVHREHDPVPLSRVCRWNIWQCLLFQNVCTSMSRAAILYHVSAAETSRLSLSLSLIANRALVANRVLRRNGGPRRTVVWILIVLI